MDESKCTRYARIADYAPRILTGQMALRDAPFSARWYDRGRGQRLRRRSPPSRKEKICRREQKFVMAAKRMRVRRTRTCVLRWTGDNASFSA